MPLFAISLLFECHIAGVLPPDPMHELAIHIVKTRDEAEARARGPEIGASRQHSYRNSNDEDVSWVFERVVECQDLLSNELSDGMKVSSWLYRGKCLCLNDGWSAPSVNPS